MLRLLNKDLIGFFGIRYFTVPRFEGIVIGSLTIVRPAIVVVGAWARFDYYGLNFR